MTPLPQRSTLLLHVNQPDKWQPTQQLLPIVATFEFLDSILHFQQGYQPCFAVIDSGFYSTYQPDCVHPLETIDSLNSYLYGLSSYIPSPGLLVEPQPVPLSPFSPRWSQGHLCTSPRSHPIQAEIGPAQWWNADNCVVHKTRVPLWAFRRRQ